MATFAAHIQKNFKLVIEDGLPHATVETIKSIQWVRCCPLCGSVHQVVNMKLGEPYTPMCQMVPALFKAELAAWQKLYPDVTNLKTLHLVEKTESA